MPVLTKEKVLEKIGNREGFAGETVENLDFSGLTLDGANFNKAKIVNCYFSGTSLKRANFSRAELQEVDFSEGTLEGVDFSRSTLTGVTFMDAHMMRAKFTGSEIWNTIFLGATLTGSTFLESTLENANFTECRLTGANFEECLFQSTNFWRADLSRAKFRDANLQNTNFENAFLIDADLFEANLTNARLYLANLKGANLVDAVFGEELYYEQDHRLRGASGTEKVVEKDYSKAKEVYLQIKNNYSNAGRYEDERSFYVKEMETTKRSYFQKGNRKKWLLFFIWEKLCLYGEDSLRFIQIAIGQLIVYSAVYWCFSLLQISSDGKRIGLGCGHEFRDAIRCLYFSAVASSTTGFGDITPMGPVAEMVAATHVLLGYILLGAMMTVLARKVIR